jgi:predicted MPP superfamily phosphohydrolase
VDWTIITYLGIVFATLAILTVLLKNFSNNVFSYVVAEVIYGCIASYAALKVAHDFFMVFTLLAIGGFVGGPIFLALCIYYSRKKFKLMAGVNAVVLVCTLAVAIDAFLIEPHMLEIKRHAIVSDKLDTPLHVAIVSDLQTDNLGDYERSVFQTVANEKPDLLLLPGDYIQTMNYQEWAVERDKFKQTFKDLNLTPKYGTFAVQGNVDDFACWQQLFTDVPGHTFEQSETVSAGPVDITGLSFYDGRNSELKYPKKEKNNKFHIVMAHYPDFSLGKVEGDLLVAGHCHGGQVQLPFYGPLMTASNIPKRWVNGDVVLLPSGSKLIVSRGVGMERQHAPRLRFCCRPQLIFVDLLPSKIKPVAKTMMSPVVSSWDQRSEY